MRRDDSLYEYKGYEYSPNVEEEEDNRKIFHDVFTPEGKRTHIDWSPYSYLSKEDFHLWIDLGMPGRVEHPNGGSCNLDHDSLNKLWSSAVTFIKEIKDEKSNPV